MIYFNFLILVVIIVSGSIVISKQAEIIEENSKFNALIVGSLLALATSLPELATGITSSLIGQSAMSISNVLGSNVFNILILAIMNVVFFKLVVYNEIDRRANRTNIFVLLMYALLAVTFILNPSGIMEFGRINIASLLIIVIYAIALKSLDDGGQQQVEENHEIDPKAFRKATLTFIALAVVILFTSIQLAKVAEQIMIESGLSASFVGAVFIGVSTSLPELVTCTTLMRARQYDMAATGVLGSNLFNFLILAIVDISDKGSLFAAADSGIYTLVAVGFIYLLITTLLIQFKVKNKYANLVAPVLLIASYIMMLV